MTKLVRDGSLSAEQHIEHAPWAEVVSSLLTVREREKDEKRLRPGAIC